MVAEANMFPPRALLAVALLVCCILGVNTTPCAPGQVVIYRLVLDTHWSPENFPKQYPEFRPPAQWTRLIGRSHNASFHLFSEGKTSSYALQQFAEKGISDGMDSHRQGYDGVLDTFGAEAILHGEGRTQTTVFLDGKNSKVSFVMRMVPSPDWFIGVDSVDLCDSDGHWIQEKTIKLDPLDAGTNSGFTFTSPTWRNDPPQPVSVITAHEPEHPVASFYYPELERLPAIATLHLNMVRMYNLGREFKIDIPAVNSRVITSEDLEEISNQLHPTVPKSTAYNHDNTDLTPDIINIAHFGEDHAKQYKSRSTIAAILVSAHRSPSKSRIIDQNTAAILNENPNSKHVTTAKKHVRSGIDSADIADRPNHRIRNENRVRIHKTILRNGTVIIRSQEQIRRRQRIRAIRRRKLAEKRRQLEEERKNQEFITSDGNFFSHN